MSDTPRTNGARVSAEFIRREMDLYRHKFILADVCAEIERELLMVKKNAERYKFIRENPAWETEAFLSGLSPDEFDAAVDARMTKK